MRKHHFGYVVALILLSLGARPCMCGAEPATLPATVPAGAAGQTAKAAIQALATRAQVDLDLQLSGNDPQDIDAQIQSLPFWEAMERICDQRKLACYGCDGQKITVAHGYRKFGPREISRSPDGSLLKLDSFYRETKIDYGPGNPRSDELHVNIQILRAPNQRFIRFTNMEIAEVKDGGGQTLRCQPFNFGTGSLKSPERLIYDTVLTLIPNHRGPGTLRVLRGQLRGTIAKGQRSITIANTPDAQAITHKLPDVEFTVRPLHATDVADEYEAQVDVVFANKILHESASYEYYHLVERSFHVETGEGALVKSVSRGARAPIADGRGFPWFLRVKLSPSDAASARVILVVPQTTEEAAITFDFHELQHP